MYGQDGDEALVRAYREFRNIPEKNILNIYDTSMDSWDSVFDKFVTPVKAKLNELGPKSIHYIVLIGLPRTVKYRDAQSERKVSICSLTNVIYTVGENDGWYNNNNPYYARSSDNTFRRPRPRFDHQYGIYHMASIITETTPLNEPEPTEGVDIVDSRYGDITHIVDLDTYPKPDSEHIYQPYEYMMMDYKHVCLAMYYEEIGKEDYLWHKGGGVYGANGEPKIKAKSWLGWYDGNYYDAFEWQPKSYWSQVHSGKRAAERAIEAGCSFVCLPEFEPFTSGVPQPAEIGYYINRGYTYGEAVIYALPMFLWANNCFGDPLLRRE